MKKIILYALALLTAILLTACYQQVIPNTFTPSIPISAKSLIPTLTFTPTITTTVIAPSGTVSQQQTSLSGKVFLVYPGQPGGKPFGFSVELYQQDKLVAKSQIEATAFYDFYNIQPGIYEIWVLIPAWSLGMSNCYDIELPDTHWKLGQLINSNQPVLLENISYREALYQSANDGMLDDLYGVFDELEIKSGISSNFDVNFICKRHK